MRSIAFAAACLVALAVPARAGITSAYTDFDTDEICTTFSASGKDEAGDWADLVCDGWRGYPVFLYYADARESLFYGFPPAGDLAPTWESFDAFNSSGPKIEWRLDDSSGSNVPFATIHRRFVSDPEDDAKKTEVLVVSKVGQPGLRDGCVVGYVAATGNPRANEQAREIADGAGSFACGSDSPAIRQDKVPVPPFSRSE
jgi:hypothetical protein